MIWCCKKNVRGRTNFVSIIRQHFARTVSNCSGFFSSTLSELGNENDKHRPVHLNTSTSTATQPGSSITCRTPIEIYIDALSTNTRRTLDSPTLWHPCLVDAAFVVGTSNSRHKTNATKTNVCRLRETGDDGEFCWCEVRETIVRPADNCALHDAQGGSKQRSTTERRFIVQVCADSASKQRSALT
jgi:hypothetical protein